METRHRLSGTRLILEQLDSDPRRAPSPCFTSPGRATSWRRIPARRPRSSWNTWAARHSSPRSRGESSGPGAKLSRKKKKKQVAHRRHPRSVGPRAGGAHSPHTARGNVRHQVLLAEAGPWGHALWHQCFHRSTYSTSRRNNMAAGAIHLNILGVPSRSNFVTIWIPGVQGRGNPDFELRRAPNFNIKTLADNHGLHNEYGTLALGRPYRKLQASSFKRREKEGESEREK